MDLEEALRGLGFTRSRRARGIVHYAHAPNRYLTYFVQDPGDGTLLFTWEFAIAEYAAALGLQVGSDEHLNTFLYPREDARGPRDPAWVAAQMDRVEETLRRFSLVDADGPAG